MQEENYKFLKLLSQEYPDIPSATAEIINLNAILNLPKGTEHFLSDLHGEYEAFTHILKNGSGVVKKKLNERFGRTMTEAERKSLASLIYYPEKKLEIVKKSTENLQDWYMITLYRLIDVCRYIASKYTRSKVRKAMPKNFGYILDELIHIQADGDNKKDYYSEIVNTIIGTDCADAFIIALSNLISRLCIDRLHIIGDIYDRGPGAEIIMDTLCDYHAVDIQWGNHDIAWMGAACGSEACIANVIRISAKYNHLDTLEDGYGISLRPLSTFALQAYANDPCTQFIPEDYNNHGDLETIAKLHKAIAIIQFKLEAQVIARNPHLAMEHMLFLDKIDFATGRVRVDKKVYPLTDAFFPTVNPVAPYALTRQEQEVIDRLKTSFLHSEHLQKHVRFLYAKGGMYTTFNSNLLYHGCIPMEKDGSFLEFDTGQSTVRGKALLDYADRMARKAYFGKDETAARDFMWYLWCGKASPLYGKNKMTTFERYFIGDKALMKEQKNAYYDLYDNCSICSAILQEFGLDPQNSHIINGHVPVRIKKGETPIKAGGKLLMIDGGLSRPYQSKTGIAGYTLIYNSYGLQLVTHEPFVSTQKAIEDEQDIHSVAVFIEKTPTRLYVADTDVGRSLQVRIEDLKLLIQAYRDGITF